MKTSTRGTFHLLRPVNLSLSAIHFTLLTLFFFSGISALIYQLMWQRMLFVSFGVDMESITIIVAVFMFGLGVGGILGGIMADVFIEKLLLLYIVIEMSIGFFGFLSPFLLESFSKITATTEWETALYSFLMLLFPTLLMGATFPILVTHVNRSYHNVGRSVGGLYFANTLGGMIGAFLSGFVLLNTMDIYAAINRAAIINILIAFVAYLLFQRRSSC